MMSVFSRYLRILESLKKQTSPNRRISVGNRPPLNEELYPPEEYLSNKVITSKYTFLNFLPKNLFEQFRRIANFYFLCIGIVQLTIDTPVTPATSILPLVFVIFVTAVKQGYEDYLRHQMDSEVNHRHAVVVRNGLDERVHSKEIKVGDIVRVHINEGFPCDLVMLSSSEIDGTCYVTTANLDGETNLKTHCCVAETRSFQHAIDFKRLEATIECQQPIADLYKFIGNITVNKEGNSLIRPLGPENVLLRGARLRNTNYVYGCAVYTGQETKLAKNSKFKQTKFSRVERAMNAFLLVFMIVLFGEAAVATGLKYWFKGNSSPPWYMPQSDTDKEFHQIVNQFLAFVVLFNYVIPISLYVTVEIQKFVGSMFFAWDNHLYDAKSRLRARANTSDLNEELGQVEFLFTDKTGTLTENMMLFRQCSINGTKYMEVNEELCLYSDNDPKPIEKFSSQIEEFFAVLTLCHTVRVDTTSGKSPTPSMASRSSKKKGSSTPPPKPRVYSPSGKDYEYQASSPDEKALIEACRRYGIIYHGIVEDYMEVTFQGKLRRYRIMNVLDFDPVRKRMSIIIQNEQNELYLLCKGAESAIIDRVSSGDKDSVLKHVNEYAQLGLRTLVVAQRKLPNKEFEVFDKKLNDARVSLQEREERLAEAFDHIENDFHLLGATAVEDKLQEYVPKTFIQLREAGIKVWMLTGDKAETAVNISHSAGHFQAGMKELWVTKMQTSTECAEKLSQFYHLVESKKDNKEKFALIIDGHSLAIAIHDHRSLLLSLCLHCDSVLCCRMSPVQKAQIVHMIKNSSGRPVTAAIGDGANDVSMIQEADVGLGIMGKEGRQAATCSDYAFARFHFILRVLLLHGHYYYVRIANLVQYFFYKNIVFIFPQFYFTFYSAYSEQPIYDGFFLMFFNIAFTSLPILCYGIFEQHIHREVLLAHPYLYKRVRKNTMLDWRYFILWNSMGIWHSLVAFFGVFFLIGNEVSLFQNGKSVGIWCLGTLTFSVAVIIVNVKLALRTYYWCLPIALSFLVSLLAFTIMSWFYNQILWPFDLVSQQPLHGVINTIISCLNVWLSLVILCLAGLVPDVIIRTVADMIYVYKQSKRAESGDNFTNVVTKGSRNVSVSRQCLVDS